MVDKIIAVLLREQAGWTEIGLHERATAVAICVKLVQDEVDKSRLGDHAIAPVEVSSIEW